MKIYHGRWDDSSKEFIAECADEKEVDKVIYNYIPEKYKHGYIRWTDDRKEHGQYIVDYGSWSDFIFVTELNDEMKNMFNQ